LKKKKKLEREEGDVIDWREGGLPRGEAEEASPAMGFVGGGDGCWV